MVKTCDLSGFALSLYTLTRWKTHFRPNTSLDSHAVQQEEAELLTPEAVS